MTAKAEATSSGIDQEKSTARTEAQAARVLPADIYDTVEFSALVYEGIGANFLTEPKEWNPPPPNKAHAPFCVMGHAGFASGTEDYYENPIADALKIAFGGEINAPIIANNRAVQAINMRKRHKDLIARVSFKDWCAEMNIVRGDS